MRLAPPVTGTRPRPCRHNDQRVTEGRGVQSLVPFSSKGEGIAMRSRNTDKRRSPRKHRGRTVVRLDTAALWKRLTLLNRSQN